MHNLERTQHDSHTRVCVCRLAVRERGGKNPHIFTCRCIRLRNRAGWNFSFKTLSDGKVGLWLDAFLPEKNVICRESFCLSFTKLLPDRTILKKKIFSCECYPSEWESLHLIMSLLFSHLVQSPLAFPYNRQREIEESPAQLQMSTMKRISL